MLEVMEEKAMIQFLEKFTDYPFLVRFQGHEYTIGEGEPSFTVIFQESHPCFPADDEVSRWRWGGPIWMASLR